MISASIRVRSSSSGAHRWVFAVTSSSGASWRMVASLSRRSPAAMSGASGGAAALTGVRRCGRSAAGRPGGCRRGSPRRRSTGARPGGPRRRRAAAPRRPAGRRRGRRRSRSRACGSGSRTAGVPLPRVERRWSQRRAQGDLPVADGGQDLAVRAGAGVVARPGQPGRQQVLDTRRVALAAGGGVMTGRRSRSRRAGGPGQAAGPGSARPRPGGDRRCPARRPGSTARQRAATGRTRPPGPARPGTLVAVGGAQRVQLSQVACPAGCCRRRQRR